MSLPHVTVWSEKDSPRLRYVLDWLLTERLGLTYELTSDASGIASMSHCIAYGQPGEAPSIHCAGFLWEKDEVKQQDIKTEEWQGLYTLFFDESSQCDLQFDMLSGIFYLLSRYEEYLPFHPDRHNRYPASESILDKVLERPIVDEWVEALRRFLEQAWNLTIPARPFYFRASYDIDIAWSYRFKGAGRTIGGALKDISGRNWAGLAQRIRVLRQVEEDPYNSFVFLQTLHMMDEEPPLYFVLAAHETSPFDKNILPTHPRMAALIRILGESALLGVHPSYYSDKKEKLLVSEKSTLEKISHQPVVHSRQHYIKLRFPETYRALMMACIEEDWSMGYSANLGFRAGTGVSFLWYDLKEERVMPLRVHPFAFMDSTAHYDLGLTAAEAFARLRAMAAKAQAANGGLVTIMHNYSLGTDREWKGWRKEYERFIGEIQKPMASF